MARVFNGDDKISYGHLSALDGAAQVAVSFWIYPGSSTSYDSLIAQGGANGSGTGNASGLEILHNAAEARSLFVSARNNDNVPYEQYFSTSTLALTTWQNVIVQYDGTQGTNADRIRVYVDATERTGPTNAGTTPATLGTTDQPLMIGANSGGSSQFLTSGRIAGVFIWTGVVLDSTERSALAAGGLGADVHPSGLVLSDGLWQGTTPTNAVTSTAATVTGTTEDTDPPLLDPPPASGQPLVKRHGGIIHAIGARPLGVRRW